MPKPIAIASTIVPMTPRAENAPLVDFQPGLDPGAQVGGVTGSVGATGACVGSPVTSPEGDDGVAKMGAMRIL